jgi:O-antigen/teichoic acid export membrane protein
MSLRILSRDIAFYGVLDFLQRSLTILLVPIYTRVLSQGNYGDLDLIMTAVSALTVIADLQFTAGFSRLYLENRKIGEGPRFAGTTILTRIALGTVIAALFLALGYSGFLEFKAIPSFRTYSTAWTIAAINVPVTFAFDILLVQAQMLRRKNWFFAGAFGNTLLLAGLSIVFTVVVPMGIVGILLAQLLGKIISTGILLVGLRLEVAFSHHRQLLKEIAQYSLPLVPGRWMGHADAYVSRFFIYAALGASENAILAITTKLAAIISLFCVAFRSAWQPLAMSYIGDERGEVFFVRSLRLLTAGGVFTIFCLTALSRPILAILAPPSYAVAEYYVPWFLIALMIGELENSLQLGNQIAKKSYWISISSGISFAVNLIILIALAFRLGIYAAGLGALLSSVARVAMTYFSSQRNNRIAYDRRSLLVFASACLTLLLLTLTRGSGFISSPVFYVTLISLAMVLPWFMLDVVDREVVRVMISGLLGRIFNGRRAQHS